jgi:hypothetical protein
MTVSGETLSALAVSSTLKGFQRVVERDQISRLPGGTSGISSRFTRARPPRFEATRGRARSSEIRRIIVADTAKTMGAVRPVDIRDVDQTEPGLVHQSGALNGAASPKHCSGSPDCTVRL